MENLAKRIQAVLFIHGEPLSVEYLAGILDFDKTAIRRAAEELDQKLTDTALTLVWSGNYLQLVTRSAFAKDVERLVKDEVSRDISGASAETLAIVAYRGPLAKSEIDYIRGVNSSHTLRNLLLRGLVRRTTNPKNSRTFIYQTTIDFLKFLGFSKVDELPEYSDFRSRFEEVLSIQVKEE